MKPWNLDVAVLCIFFARPEQFKKVLERVCEVKPKILLFWQDGPRSGRPDDIINIKKCRDLLKMIDWDCQIYKNFHSENMGCDPSTHLSHKWAFSIVDKCIILEDDIVPSVSFFSFCKELLDRYENDTRIDRICGQTLYGGIDCKRYSYFFSRSGSSWGWATWKRVADTWETEYDFLKDEYYLDLARYRFGHKRFDKSLQIAQKRAKEGIPYWEHIVGFRTLLSSGLVIYPAVNLIENVGTSINATHAPNDLNELPKEIQQMFTTKACELSFPLKHPPYIIEDYHYFYKIIKHIEPSFYRKISRKLEHLFRILIYRYIKQ